MRPVGEESRKTYQDKLDSGFFAKYMSGSGLEIGGTGYLSGVVPILDTATNVELGYPGYDGRTLPFPDNSQDYVYSSHVLEHIVDYKHAIQEWYRVVKVGGHIIIVVPHQYLYEKKLSKPSRYNEDHQRFYAPANLLKEVEDSLSPNSYRVRLLRDNDKNFDYSIPPETHSSGCYEIELVIQKIKKPDWSLT